MSAKCYGVKSIREAMMKEKILRVNNNELTKVRWDGEMFVVIQENGDGWYESKEINTIIFNPKEMLELIKFAGSYV